MTLAERFEPATYRLQAIHARTHRRLLYISTAAHLEKHQTQSRSLITNLCLKHVALAANWPFAVKSFFPEPVVRTRPTSSNSAPI